VAQHRESHCTDENGLMQTFVMSDKQRGGAKINPSKANPIVVLFNGGPLEIYKGLLYCILNSECEEKQNKGMNRYILFILFHHVQHVAELALISLTMTTHQPVHPHQNSLPYCTQS
jgi:hypothetical protein